MNTTHRYSASSSSSLSSDEVDSNNACEDHHSKCTYKTLEGYAEGAEVWAHFRICKCGLTKDRSNELRESNKYEQDGVELHFHESCKWRHRKEKSSRGTIYRLQRHCVCKASAYSATNSHMNYVAPDDYSVTTNSVDKMTIESPSKVVTYSCSGGMAKRQKSGQDGDQDGGDENVGMRQEAHIEPGPSDMTKAIILAAYNDEPEMYRVQFATTPSDDESLPPDPIQFTADEISPVPRRHKHKSKASQSSKSSKTAEYKQDPPTLQTKEYSGAPKYLKQTNN